MSESDGGPVLSNPVDIPTTEQASGMSKVPSDLQAGAARATLISLLPLILTAATFFASFAFQIVQQQIQRSSAEDAEWRKALEDVSADSSSQATRAAYEMESFINSRKYGAQARQITASLLPKIDDKFSFDLILFDLLPGTTQRTQYQIISIDVLISQQLRDAYSIAKSNFNGATMSSEKMTFQSFLDSPDRFYDPKNQAKDLDYTSAKIWELESTTNALSSLWIGSGKGSTITPQGQVLNKMVLFGNDFTGVDFRTAAAMKNVNFCGKYTVTNALFAQGVAIVCSEDWAPE